MRKKDWLLFWKSENIIQHFFNEKSNEFWICITIFKIKKTHNIVKDIVTYQSKLELKFIQSCNKENILIFGKKSIDFLIPLCFKQWTTSTHWKQRLDILHLAYLVCGLEKVSHSSRSRSPGRWGGALGNICNEIL